MDREEPDQARLPTLRVVVAQLDALLGRRLVAYIGAAASTSQVRDWIAGEPVDDSTAQRLRLALEAAALVAGVEGRDIAQAWFQGMQPELEDVSPARAIRDGDPTVVRDAVLASARAFLT